MTTTNPLNLTDVEYAIFKQILTHKEIPLGKVIKHLGLHKGTAYNAIRRLEEKGIVCYKTVDRVNIYSVPPLALEVLLRELNDSHKERVEDIEHLIEVAKDNESSLSSANVNVLVGVKGFKSFFDDLLMTCYRKKEEYYFMGNTSVIIDKVGEEHMVRMMAKKKKLKVRTKAVSDQRTYGSNIDYSNYGDIRYLDRLYLGPTSTWMYDDKVVVVLGDADPLLTIVIKSESAYISYRHFFDSLWSFAKSKKIVYETRQNVHFKDFLSTATEKIDFCGITCILPIHNGKNKIMDLLNKGGSVRLLISNPKSDGFRKAISYDEQFLEDFSESRVLFEQKSVIANVKDINKRCKGRVEVRFYDALPRFSIFMVDDKKVLFNRYSYASGKYASSSDTTIIDGGVYPEEADKIKSRYERLWKQAKPIAFSEILHCAGP